MSPVNFGEMSKYMGPLTSGGMMSEQHRMAMGESEVNQNKGLEDILTSQQTRDIARQKLPGELENQRLTNEGKKVDTEDKLSKLNREKYGYFVNDVINFTPTDDPMADAFRLEETAKRSGMDPQDPRVRFALTQAGNKEQLKALQKALTFNDPKHQQKLAEQAAQDAEAMKREKLQRETQITTTGMNNRTQLEIANIRRDQALQVAKAKAASGSSAEGKKNYAQAFTAYTEAADAAEMAGDSFTAQRLRQRANLMAQMDAHVRGAAANTARAGGMVLPPSSGIHQRDPVPTPTVSPISSMPGYQGQATAGVETQATPAAAPTVKWGRDANGNPIRIQ